MTSAGEPTPLSSTLSRTSLGEAFIAYTSVQRSLKVGPHEERYSSGSVLPGLTVAASQTTPVRQHGWTRINIQHLLVLEKLTYVGYCYNPSLRPLEFFRSGQADHDP